MSNLKLEVFESNKPIEQISFYVYSLVPKELVENIQQVIRGAVWKIFYDSSVPAFTDDRRIYTLSKLENLEIDDSYTIRFESEEKLEIQSNKKIYSDLAEYFIKEKLSSIKIVLGQKTYPKYKIKKDTTTVWLEELKSTLSSNDKNFRLKRKYDFNIKISDDNRLHLWLNIKSEFETSKTIYDLLKTGSVNGLEVANDWKGRETGTIISVGPETVSDNLPNFTSLKQYMINTKQEFRIANCPDESPVVHVKISNKKELCYYPQALKPVITLEIIARENPEFSRTIEKYTKLDMKSRYSIAKKFLEDIGTVETLNNLEFLPAYVDSEKIGFTEKNFPLPTIICGNNRVLSYNKQSMVFANGFFRQPENTVKFAYFYPKEKHDLMRQFAISLTDFLIKGQLFGKTNYLIPNLMTSEIKAVCHQEYEIGDPINYKKLVRSLSDENKFDVAIVLVPTEEDESNPYSTFKTAWAEKNIPSQMISIKTAQMFYNKDPNAVWYMQNIALGIFSKAGGIPWIVDNIPGEVDCFVGIDVATIDKGIHYPTCATVFDKNGRPISFYKPKKAQKGEKINSDILQEIFDEVILGYEENTGSKLKNIIIHRDGFSNEDAEWYKNYFSAKGINYSVIEVKKYVHSKLLIDNNGIISNPACGNTLLNDSEAYIVTTDIKDGRASPRPLHIKKQVGSLSMETIVQQILALSCMHFGATKKSRLPVTTYYADKICKNIDYVPEGKFGNRLFFL